MNVAIKNENNSKHNEFLRKYHNDFDDDTVESLKQHYNIEGSDDSQFLKYVKQSRSMPTIDDLTEE